MKFISCSNDLAINGAAPAFDEPIHVGRPNISNRTAFLSYIEEIFDRNWLTNNGPLVRELEQKLSEYLGVKHCIAMCNGTIALEIAIRALGLQGEVIVPSYTFIATAHALHWQALTPVFADIDAASHNLDPAAVKRMITSRTTGIIGVHLWGRCAPVEHLQAIADENGLKLLFDASHAFGCSRNGTMIGGFGECEIFSFHATKFFNTFEGGAVATNNDLLADKLRLMRNFGFSGFDNVIHPGTNGKMTEVAAAMGLANLETLDAIVEKNRAHHRIYQQELAEAPGVELLSFDDSERNNYQYVVIEIKDECPASRDLIVEALHAENVLARKYFWPGCHRMKPYRELFPNAGLLLSNTESVADRVVVLPTGSAVDDEAIRIIANIIRICTTDKHEF